MQLVQKVRCALREVREDFDIDPRMKRTMVLVRERSEPNPLLG